MRRHEMPLRVWSRYRVTGDPRSVAALEYHDRRRRSADTTSLSLVERRLPVAFLAAQRESTVVQVISS